MSIYTTILDIGGEHLPRCARMTKIAHKTFSVDDSKECTCGACPVLFQGSHVLPSNRDKRGGCIMLAGIRGHITRNGKDDGPENEWHPWLRLSVFELGSDSVVLTRKQAEKLRDSITKWLEVLRG
jgi:hypothetical protein